MEWHQLEVRARVETGKGSARRARRRGMIPGILYGPDTEPVPVEIDPKGLLKAMMTKRGRNTILKLKAEDSSLADRTVLVKDLQRHPVKRVLEHADLYEVKMDRPVEIEVPVSVTGRAKGVIEGGVLQVVRRRLKIRCLPDRIPEEVTIDVSDLGLGQSIHIGDLPLEDGITPVGDKRFTIVTVVAPRAEEKTPAELAAEQAAAEAAAPAAEGEKAEKAGEEASDKKEADKEKQEDK